MVGQDVVGEGLRDMDFSNLLTDQNYKSAIYQIAENLEDAVTSKVLALAMALALAMSVYNHWARTKEVNIDTADIIRIVVIGALVYSYTILYTTLDGATDGVIGEFGKRNERGMVDFYKYMTAREAMTKYNLSPSETAELAANLTGNPNSDKEEISRYISQRLGDSDLFSEIGDFIDNIDAQISNTTFQFFLSIAKILQWVIKYAVSTFLVFYSAVVGIGGSVALTLSLLFNDAQVARAWLKNFLIAKIAFITFMIVEGINEIFYTIAVSGKVTNTNMYSPAMDYLMIGLFFGSVVMFATPIATTMKYTFSSSAGNFLSNATGAMLLVTNAVTKNLANLMKKK